MPFFDPSSDPIVIRALCSLYERPEATFIYVHRRIFQRRLEDIIADLADIPFDQLAFQIEAQLAEHFPIRRSSVHFALHGLRRKLEMNPRTGASRRGKPGKKTLARCVRNPGMIDFKAQLAWADGRIKQILDRLSKSDAELEKFVSKNHDRLVGYLRSMTCGEEELAKDIAQSTWEAAFLLFEPGRRWSFEFVKRVARNLLRNEWARRRQWNEVEYLDGVALGEGSDDLDLSYRPPLRDLPAGMASPAVDDEPAFALSLVAAEALLRPIMAAPCLPLDRALFIALAILKRRPRFLVRDYARMTLAAFVDELEQEFSFQSRLPDEFVEELFKSLRLDLGLTFFESALDGRRRDAYPQLHPRLTGATHLEDYFTTRDVTERAREVGRWAENVKKYLWSQALANNSPLSRVLKELNPAWGRAFVSTRKLVRKSKSKKNAAARASARARLGVEARRQVKSAQVTKPRTRRQPSRRSRHP